MNGGIQSRHAQVAAPGWLHKWLWRGQYSFLALFATMMLIFGLGCGGGGGGSHEAGSCNCPQIVTFTVTPLTQQEGLKFTLHGVFNHGDGVITPGNLPIQSGVDLQTTATIGINAYTLTVNEPGTSNSVSLTVDVTVIPFVGSLTFEKPAVSSGSSDLATVHLQTGATATIPGVAGTFTDGQTANVPADVVTALETQTVTMKVTTAAGTVKDVTGSFQVVPLPVIISFTASPNPGTVGSTVALIPVFTGGTGVIGNVGTVTTGGSYTSPALSGSTTYTLTVTNSLGDTVSKTITVGVVSGGGGSDGIEFAITSYQADNYTVQYGSMANLTWTLSIPDPATLVLDSSTIPNGVTSHNDVLGNYSYNVLPVERSNYVLSGTGPDGHADSKTLQIVTRGLDIVAGNTGPMGSYTNMPGVAYDPSNFRLYATDQADNTIRVIYTQSGFTEEVFAGSQWSPGYGDGYRTGAMFNGPTGIACDSAGNVYVADTGNHAIRMIDTSGNVTTIAGNPSYYGSQDGTWGTASASGVMFNSPEGVSVDMDGNVWVADSGNKTVRCLPVGYGNSVTYSGTPDVAFADPVGVAFDTFSRKVFVVDDVLSAVFSIVPSNGATALFAGSVNNSGSTDGTGSDAQFYQPGGITCDGSGDVYVSDTSNGTIRKISGAGQVSTYLGVAGSTSIQDGPSYNARFNHPMGLAFWPGDSESLFIADSLMGKIRYLQTDGNVTTAYDDMEYTIATGYQDGTLGQSMFNNPEGLACDSSGNTFVADSGNNAIRKIDTTGNVTTYAGGQNYGSFDGNAGNASFRSPGAVACDAAGNVYVADTGNNLIRKIDKSQNVTTIAGQLLAGKSNGQGTEATFNGPNAIASDSAGNLYVCEGYNNNTIRKIDTTGLVTTFAGQDTPGSANGNALTTASFYWPTGLALDPSGNLFVLEYGNNAIRKIDTSGNVTRFGAGTQLGNPGMVACDSLGNVYVADTANMVEAFTPDGTGTYLAGTWDYSNPTTAGMLADAYEASGTAQFGFIYQPYGIAVNPFGDVLVSISSGIMVITDPYPWTVVSSPWHN